ncbi:protein kinase family protein [Legionella longbeachae]|uniref:serine/threonine protein kinase n=1 Tax=Legionella longbeachae TaxID=450 RepID=UPI001244B906|nr:serine/threonine protein kinase [Legionella longbeachae]QEY49928.1 serine/threonine protein kinase [Legionella longbeachae]
MSIKRIANREENPKITKLNDYIDQYNQMELKPGAKLILQKIDAMRTQIYSDAESRNQGNFMEWYLTDPVRTEISRQQLGQDKNLIFIEDSKGQIKNLTRSNWEKMTKPMIGKRSENYCNMDNLIHDVETANQNVKAHPSPQALFNLKNALEALQHQTLLIINNDIHHNKPNMKRHFEALLNTTNHLLKELVHSNPELISTPKQEYTSLIQSLIAEDPKSQEELIRKLSTTQEQLSLNGFNVIYLGGGNNKNWLAINEETGEQCIIRLEKADDPKTDYSLVEEMKRDETIKNNLAQDYFYCPMILPALKKHFADRAINVAVSELCQDGDIRSHHLRTLANTPENDKNRNRCSGTLDTIEQIARIASDFNKKGMAYMDIKATNFLRRADEQLITADIKSVVRTNEKNQVSLTDISTTFGPPEYNFGDESYVEADSYMAYQIGLVAYDLMVSTQEHDAQHIILDKLERREPLDFDLPVFNTPEGKEIKVLIETMLDPKPGYRPSLNMISGIAHDLRLQHGFVSETGEKLKQNDFKEEQANGLTTSQVISPQTNSAEYSNKNISAQEFSKQFKHEYRNIIRKTEEPFEELLEEEPDQTMVLGR